MFASSSSVWVDLWCPSICVSQNGSRIDGQGDRLFIHASRRAVMGVPAARSDLDRPHVLGEVLALIETLTGKRAQIEHIPTHVSDIGATWANVEKARRLLGWSAQVSLEDGVRQMVAWYNANRTWARDIATNG